MGTKGDKLKQASVLSAELLAEKLSSIAGITLKKMFGGHGVFHDGKMFGIVDSKGHCYLKVNESTKGDYVGVGSEQHSRMPYFRIPVHIFDDHDALLAWAQKAIAASK